jgi:hypothetical protein
MNAPPLTATARDTEAAAAPIPAPAARNFRRSTGCVALLRAALLIDYTSLARARGICVPSKSLTAKHKYRRFFPAPVGGSFESGAGNAGVRETLWILLQRVSLFRLRDLRGRTY